MFTISEILNATGGKLVNGEKEKSVVGVSLDSRTVKPDELFIALSGERYDGHDFIQEALRKGAGAILFSQPDQDVLKVSARELKKVPMIRVKNTIFSLGDLAHWHRMKFRIPVIGITGSNGKTTTKEMLAALLSTRYRLLFNPGTQNNHIGVPLTLLRLRKEHAMCILEMGTNHFGEIDRLARIAQPTMAVITNIGPSHLEFLKTLAGVRKAKLELLPYLPKGAKVIINRDDRILFPLKKASANAITFGFNPDAQYRAEVIKQSAKGINFRLNHKQKFFLPLFGRHNIYNALASITAARCFGLSYQAMQEALAVFKPLPMRMQTVSHDGVTLFVDCYNSNPASMAYALDFLKDYATQGRRIAIFGDMLELGARAAEIHAQIGRKIVKSNIDILISVGKLAKHIVRGAHGAGMPRKTARTCRTAEEAAALLGSLVGPGDIVLVKGSRAMKMENTLKCFTGFSIH